MLGLLRMYSTYGAGYAIIIHLYSERGQLAIINPVFKCHLLYYNSEDGATFILYADAATVRVNILFDNC